jgi:hypothetical protein
MKNIKLFEDYNKSISEAKEDTSLTEFLSKLKKKGYSEIKHKTDKDGDTNVTFENGEGSTFDITFDKSGECIFGDATSIDTGNPSDFIEVHGECTYKTFPFDTLKDW